MNVLVWIGAGALLAGSYIAALAHWIRHAERSTPGPFSTEAWTETTEVELDELLKRGS